MVAAAEAGPTVDAATIAGAEAAATAASSIMLLHAVCLAPSASAMPSCNDLQSGTCAAAWRHKRRNRDPRSATCARGVPRAKLGPGQSASGMRYRVWRLDITTKSLNLERQGS